MDVLGGELHWSARIDTEQIESDAKKVNQAIQSTIAAADKAKAVQSQAINNILSSVDKANQSTSTVANTLETLRAKLLARKDFLITETDQKKIVAYNREIESLTKEISRLLNAGKSGFDEMGRPIKAQEGLLQKLQREAALYKKAIQEATLPENIAKYNRKLDETNAKIKQLSILGRAGADSDNPLKAQEGILQRLQRQAEIYRKGILEATLPENITKYNAKLEATNAEIKRLTLAGKSGFNEFGQELDKTANKTNILAKSFSFLKLSAAFIPGLGLQGLFTLIGQSIVDLISKLTRGGSAIKTFQERYVSALAALREGVIKNTAGDISRLELLRDILTDTASSEKERVSALNEYNSIAAEANKIDSKSINNLNEINNQISRQISLIEKRALTTAGEKLLSESAEQLLLAQEKARTEAIKEVENEDAHASNMKVANAKKVDKYFEQLERDGRIRRKIASNEEVKNAQAEFEARKKALKASIDLGGGFTGTADPDKVKAIKPDKELNELLSERVKLLEDIAALQRDSYQSGLTKEQSAVDKVREKYALLNQKIDEYNKKAEKERAPLINKDPLIQSEKTEIENTTQKQAAQEYLQNLSTQRDAFAKFEEYKLQIGTEKAKQLAGEQIKGFESYTEYLKAELKALENDTSIGAKLKVSGLTKELQKAVEDSRNRETNQLTKSTAEVLQMTADYYTKSGELAAKYHKLREALEKASTTMTAEEYKNRVKALNEQKEEEYKALDNSFTRQTALYKRLSIDTINLSKEAIKNEIEVLENELRNNKSLTPQIKIDIKQAIDKLKSLVDAADEASSSTAKVFGMSVGDLEKLAGKMGQVSGLFADAASAVESLDEGLSEALALMGDLTNAAGQAVDAVAKFASGDIIGGIGSAIGAIGGLLGIGGKAKAEREARKREIKEMQTQIFLGEFSINELYRQRTLEIIRQNELRLQGIKAENEELQKQRVQVGQDIDKVFAELQKEQYKFMARLGDIRSGLPASLANQMVQVSGSLSGKSFQEIEELFMKGQLSDRAKELFQTLQKLKQEGVDIDRMLEENKRKAQELFTGTTADSLASSITEGLRKGFRSVQDFAENMEEMFRNAILSGFEAKVIEERMAEFYKLFAEAAESGGGLDQAEIASLKALYESRLQEILDQFNQLQSVTGVSMNTNAGNAMAGAIKGMTEETAQLLAGQFGGLRLTAIEQLNVARTSLQAQQAIQNNTALTVTRLEQLTDRMQQWFMVQGIKVQ